MRKLVVTCQCGQRMQVPRSAVGKTGMCPTCGQTVVITTDNTRPVTPTLQGRLFGLKNTSWWRGASEPPEDAKRRFGQAVDLYCTQRYAEALAIFNSLAKQFPGNPDIENGRAQCIAALKRPPALALEHKSGSNTPAKLDETTVKDIVLDKLIRGSSESVQLQAAELACRMLGLFGKNGHLTPEELRQAVNEAKNNSQSAPSADSSPGPAESPVETANEEGGTKPQDPAWT
ncbi:MAG: hypothetical protein HZB26_19825 [Candidatus Hydrogenedentes bacterium]|nr:hypothetical protein [Candidatus Hydrogenedentota bacterium]